MTTSSDFCIPMKIPKMYTLDELLKMNKDNHYLKNGQKNMYVNFYKDVDKIYYLVIPVKGEDNKVCLGNDFNKAMKNMQKVLEVFKDNNAKAGMIYDTINILYPKERSDINE